MRLFGISINCYEQTCDFNYEQFDQIYKFSSEMGDGVFFLQKIMMPISCTIRLQVI